MHIVDPSGSTKPAILGGIPSCCSATAMFVGSVALLELVENAVTMLARMRLQKTRGESPPNTRTSTDRPTLPWINRPARDRKSTRLNSSHDQISYAVFCLKKKTKIR